MRNVILASTAVAILMAAAPTYAASPCLAGMAAGGIAGHYGHHSIIGAIGGCFTAKVLVADWKKYKSAHPNANVKEFLGEKEQEMEGLLNAENGGGQ